MTQCEKIIEYMDRFGSITTMEAFSELGITRLASRIHELKANGYSITSEPCSRKNRYGETVHYNVYRIGT